MTRHRRVIVNFSPINLYSSLKLRDEIQRESRKYWRYRGFQRRFGQIDYRTDDIGFTGLRNDQKINQSLLRGNNDLCKSGVGLATAMLELLRLEGIGDFNPSVQLWPWDPDNVVRCRRTSTSLLRLWTALLLHRRFFASTLVPSNFLRR